MKIALFGNFGVQNLGDDLILESLLNDYQSKGHEVIVFCGQPAQLRKQFEVEAYDFFPGGIRSLALGLMNPMDREHWKQSKAALRSVDEVVIGGGGILVDRHPQAVLLWWNQLREIRKSQKPYRFRSNSISLKRKYSQKLLLPFLRKASAISVRDSESKSWLAKQGIKSVLVPDLAREADLKISQHLPKGIVSFALCRWELQRQQWTALQEFILTLKEKGYTVKGLAFQQKGDDDRELYKQWFPELDIVTGKEEVIRTLSHSDLLVGMRLHSLILGREIGVPLIGLPYQEKVKAFMKDEGMENQLIELKNISHQSLTKMMEKVIDAA